MTSKTTTIATILLASITAVVGATIIYNETHDNHAYVGSVKFETYLDTILLPNATDIYWGTEEDPLEYGIYCYNLTVKPLGNLNSITYLFVSNLPTGWTLTWDANETYCTPTGVASGNLNLTIPYDAKGSSHWQTDIIAVETP